MSPKRHRPLAHRVAPSQPALSAFAMTTTLPFTHHHVAHVPPMTGGGKSGDIVRTTDWSATPLGDYACWPQSLRSSLSLVRNASGIAALYWGPEQRLLYNDAMATPSASATHGHSVARLPRRSAISPRCWCRKWRRSWQPAPVSRSRMWQ